MTLYTFTVSGRIRNGKLEVELPPDAVEGQVEVQISLLEDAPPPSVTSETWELLKPGPGNCLSPNPNQVLNLLPWDIWVVGKMKA